MSLVKNGQLYVMCGDVSSLGRVNDVWKTSDLSNWSKLLSNGHNKFVGRYGARGVV